MNGGSSETTSAPSREGATVLQHRLGPSRGLAAFWPALVYVLVIALLLAGDIDSAYVKAVVVGLLSAFGMGVCIVWALTSVNVVISERSVQFRTLFGFLKTRDVPLETIEEIGHSRWSEWNEARVLIRVRKAGRRRFFTLSRRALDAPVPGDRLFQARVVKELLARRGDISVTERAAEILTGRLGVEWKHRLAVLVSMGLAVAWTSVLLVLSTRELVFPLYSQSALVFFGGASPFAACLKRESETKAAIASAGASLLPLIPPVFMLLAFLRGGLEYMPLLYGAGAAVALGSFVAALPGRLPAWGIALGEVLLVVAAVAGARFLTLRETIPVRTAYLAPPPMEVSFAPSGATVVLHGFSLDGEEAFHFVDSRTFLASTVDAGPRVNLFFFLPLDDHRVICSGNEKEDRSLWVVDAAGTWREIPGVKGFVRPLRRAVSPDGGSLALFASNKRDGGGDYETHLLILDLRTLGVRSLGVLEGKNHGNLTWRADGRLVWSSTGEGPKRWIGRLLLWSRSPEEKEARLEFESDEPWSDVSLSPACDAAFARIHAAEGEVSKLVRLPGGDGFDLPAVHLVHRVADRCWSADGSVLAVVPHDNPGAVAVVRTQTGEMSIVKEFPSCVVDATAISPDGNRLACCVSRGIFSAVYVSDLRTGETRRLRPVTFLSLSLGASFGTLAWSPSGELLAVAAFGHPLGKPFLTGAGAVWLARVP